MDRSGLTPGAELKLNTDAGYITYTIRGEVNRGGSCIVYDASYTDTLSNFKLVRIKECYPHALRIDREPEGALRVRDQDAEAFGRARGRVIAADSSR